MSGITGVWQFDQRPIPEIIRGMVARLEHRGPDASGVWCAPGVGLGHTMLRTTRESVLEKQPAVSSEAQIVLVSDARIDNRLELSATLGLRGRSEHPVSDSELILAAYAKWGAECPKRLIGDFAFAIWDARTRSVFCARDPMGVKPFYFFKSDRCFCFASEIKALWVVPEVPRRLNEVQVGYYLSGILTDRTITFYQDIQRLPAAHWMRVSADSLVQEMYWNPADVPAVRLRGDNEYTEAFLSIFSEAVRCRLNSDQAIGSALSGGMDSSSIACVARDILRKEGQSPLHTFSGIFPGLPEADLAVIDEQKYVDAVIRMGGIRAHKVRADRLSPLKDIDRVFWHMDEAPLAPNLYMHWGLYNAAQQTGVRIFLDGIDGDSAVGHGWGRLDDLLRAGEWDTFSSEVKALSERFGARPESVLRNYGFPRLHQLAREGRWVDWVRVAIAMRRRFPVSLRRLSLDHGLKQIRWKSYKREKEPGPIGLNKDAFFIRSDFAERIDLDAHWRTAEMDRSWTGTELQGHIDSLRAPIFQYGLEMCDKAAAAFSLEPRYPYFDRRLMEFCVGLPAEQKLAQGWSRMILRRAMEGILPPEIQWRPGKAKLSPNLHRKLMSTDRPLIEVALSARGGLFDEFVNVERARGAYERAASLPDRAEFGPVVERLYQPVTLGLWLDRFESDVHASAKEVAFPSQSGAAVADLHASGE